MIRYLKVPILTVAALMLTVGPLLAAHDGKAQQQGKSAQMGQQGKSAQEGKAQQQQQGKSAQMSGQILDKKEVGFKDTDKTNTVVMITTQDGRRVAVDLGPTQNLKGIDVKKDQNASVRGQWARVGDRPVLFADEFVLAGKTIQIDRPGGMKQAKSRQEQAQAREVTGEVMRTKQVEFKGTDTKHLVVMMNTEMGKQAQRQYSMVVDLGPTQNLKQVDLKKGEKISVHGKPVIMGDRLVLLADRIKANGQTVNIQRQQQQTKASS